MQHSIISFKNKNGVTLDFHRLKHKRPQTVLNKVFAGFCQWESLYLNENIKNNCTDVVIHYTDFECNNDNLTFKCSFDEFMTRYNEYKADKKKTLL